MAAAAPSTRTWITAIDDQYLPIYYATLNLWKFLGEGLRQALDLGRASARPATTEDFLRAGRALGDAIAETDRKVLLIASGALSHTFWKLRQLRDHEAAGRRAHPHPRGATPPTASGSSGSRPATTPGCSTRCRSSCGTGPRPCSRHYLMMVGALGEGDCTATARQYGDYENSIGTGQVHLWFDRPEGGFPRPHGTPTTPSTSARWPVPT